ncbi:MAG: ABC transporter ATP-binding protein [Candidatus Omnitrophica bacterium]|nr:ABC transporter ATP-binding protein [Candidatus Omnitrophota bacterium]
MKALAFIISIFKKHPSMVLSNVIVAVAMSFLGTVSFLSLPPIIDMFLYPDGHGRSSMTLKVIAVFRSVGLPTSLPFLVSVFVVLVIATSLLQVICNLLIYRTKYAIVKDFMLGAMQDFFNAKWLFFSSSDQGKIYSTLNREINAVGDGLTAMGGIFANLIQIMVLLFVPFCISWKVTCICLGLGGLVSLFFIFISRSAYELGRLNTHTANVCWGLYHENISGAKLVLGHGNAKQVLKKIEVAYDAHLDCTIKSQILAYVITTSYRPVGVIVVVAALFASRMFMVPVSEVAVLLLALLQVTNLFGNLVAQKSAISNIVPGYEQIQHLRQRALDMKQVSGTNIFKGFTKEVMMKEVSFAYPGRGMVLHNICLSIPKGKVVAFVGKSGAGKSTIIDILMGFHEINSGEVTIDGVGLSTFEINSYRKKIGYVPQDSLLFNMTIKENLLWANPEASQEEVAEACRMAYAEEFIDQLPQKFDTVVGDRGVRLSGGQIQRLALARAFLRNMDILFLDEATSSLDSHSETLIQKAIETVSGKTTVVVVAHRLATIKRADTIYVLDKGCIVEHGSYVELCRQNGIFSDLVRFQELNIVA